VWLLQAHAFSHRVAYDRERVIREIDRIQCPVIGLVTGFLSGENHAMGEHYLQAVPQVVKNHKAM
jgi:hypothetical protein